MRALVFLLVIIGLSSASTYILEKHVVRTDHTTVKNLDDLFQQFVAFIPFDKCLEIVNFYIENNEDVKQAYDFIKSDEFQALLKQLDEMPEYKEFVKYLNDSGFDYYKYRNIIRKMLGLPTVAPPTMRMKLREESGLISMIEEILGTLPIDEMRKWYLEVCLPDPDFQQLLVRIRSPEFKKLVELIYSSQQYKEAKEILLQQGIDVDEIEDAIADFLNNQFSSRSLTNLLQQFLAFIPTDDILEIFLTYVRNNDDIKRIIDYLKGDEFRALVIKIEAMEEFNDFLALIYGYKLNVYEALNLVLDILGLPTVSPEFKEHPSVQSGLTDMIHEMIALLPLDKIYEWYKSTCEPDPEFQDVLTHLRSNDFKRIVNTVKEDPAFVTIRQGLIDLDVNVENVEAFLRNYFGWD